jgi:hypothetical protein
LDSAAAESSIPFLAINCLAEGDPCLAFDVTEFPLIKLFRGKDAEVEYHGPYRSGA